MHQAQKIQEKKEDPSCGPWVFRVLHGFERGFYRVSGCSQMFCVHNTSEIGRNQLVRRSVLQAFAGVFGCAPLDVMLYQWEQPPGYDSKAICPARAFPITIKKEVTNGFEQRFRMENKALNLL